MGGAPEFLGDQKRGLGVCTGVRHAWIILVKEYFLVGNMIGKIGD